MPRPLEGHYAASLAIAIVALSPFIVVSTAYVMFAKQVQAELGMGKLGTELVAGFAIAEYAFGAFTGGDLIQRFRQRHLFLLSEALFAAGCAVSAVAANAFEFGFGRILAGFATGLLLVVALPPVIQRFPANKLRITMAWVDLGFFGAVCAGPPAGGRRGRRRTCLALVLRRPGCDRFAELRCGGIDRAAVRAVESRF